MINHNHFLTLKIWRGKDHGKLVEYQVAVRDNQTVLDLVSEVQRLHAPGLAYRFACRVGVCGSCAMTVNGIPRWTCRTHVNKVVNENRLTIEPLRNLPIIKDLVCDLAPFNDTWQKAGAPFVATKTRKHSAAAIAPNAKMRQSADASLQCINCAVCYSACDVVNWNREYVGPAALNRAWTLINDIRHAGRASTLQQAFADGGCSHCHSHGNCTRHCPVALSPSESIAGLKRAAFYGLPVDP